MYKSNTQWKCEHVHTSYFTVCYKVCARSFVVLCFVLVTSLISGFIGIFLPWSPYDCTKCQLPWKTNQTVDLCKSYNRAWSPKVVYFKLITNNMTLVEAFVAFWGNRAASSFCTLETNKNSTPDNVTIISGSKLTKHWFIWVGAK